jgi:uncharacterized protein (DUF302 family)
MTVAQAVTVTQVVVERFSLISSRSFHDVLSTIEAAVGHPDIGGFWKQTSAAKDWGEVEQVVQAALGPAGLMQFASFDHGQYLGKEWGAPGPRVMRIVAGNPLIMKEMARHVHDAGSYAPVTLLIDERPDGVHLSYDRMASFLAPYGSEEALKVARALDEKVEALLKKAAG